MRRRLWIILALLALFVAVSLPTQVKDLSSLKQDDPRLARALQAEPAEDRRLQLWLGSQAPLARLQLGIALLHQNFLRMPIAERRQLGWNLAAVSEWRLNDRGWRDEMLNAAVYVLIASEALPLPVDVARAQDLWPAFLEAVERQEKPEDACAACATPKPVITTSPAKPNRPNASGANSFHSKPTPKSNSSINAAWMPRLPMNPFTAGRNSGARNEFTRRARHRCAPSGDRPCRMTI